jgi:hypothetical protein
LVINRAIVSTDDNPLYYEFWPLVAKGWQNINIEPTVVIIGDIDLNYVHGTIIKMPVIEGIPSGFIAQVVRFIIPCLYPDQVSITADIDMVPLSRNYFSKNITQYDDDKIIVFSADAYKELRYPMCYIAAKGKYFQEIIGLKNTDGETITAFIKELFALNQNWDTDELFFAKKLHESAHLKNTVFLNRGWNPNAKNRIDRVNWQYLKIGFYFDKYIDAHCPRPLHENNKQLKHIVEYVNHGSDGKAYFYYSQKKPVRKLINYLKLFKQNYIDDDLFSISTIQSADSTKTKIISFTLYGNDPRYVENLEIVIQSYQTVLPVWKCRIYAAKDVDKQYIDLLISKGCEVIIMNKTGIDSRYTIWRFLAIEDKTADAVIVRDLDSVATNREKLMIEQWLKSEKTFHIIRDHISHNVLIMAGMWGIKKNSINIKAEARKSLITNNYGIDQVFLVENIYPKIKDSVMVHDSFPRFPHENPIMIPFDDDEGFIGEIVTDILPKN